MRLFVLLGLVICNLLSSVCYSVIVPFLPIEFEDYGLDVLWYGYIFAMYAAAGMIGSLVIGKMLTKCGRKLILISGLACMGVSMCGFGIMNIAPNDVVLIAYCLFIRAIEGFASAMIQTTSYSIVAIVFGEEQERYIGYLEASTGVGMLMGPIVGSTLYEFLGFEFTFFTIGGIFMILSPILYFIIPKSVNVQDSFASRSSASKSEAEKYAQLAEENEIEEDEDSKVIDDKNPDNKKKLIIQDSGSTQFGNTSNDLEDSNNIYLPKKGRKPVQYWDLFRHPLFAVTSFCAFLSYFEYCYMEPVMSLRLEEFEMTSIQIGLFFCIYGVMYTFTSLTISFFTDAFENKILIVVCMFCCGLVNFFVGPSEMLPDSLVLMCVGQFLNGAFANFFLITCLPVMINVAVNAFPKQKMEVTDTSSGVFTFMLGLGQTIGPIYGSNVTDAVGFRWCADTIAYILLAYSIVYLIIWKTCGKGADEVVVDKEGQRKGLDQTYSTLVMTTSYIKEDDDK